MDTGKQYIKMCKEADEIQKLRIPDKCITEDIIYVSSDKYDSGKYLYGCDGFRYDLHYHYRETKGKYWQIDEGRTTTYISDDASIVWLPRQDQLQDMLKANTKENLTVYLVLMVEFADMYGWSNQDNHGAKTYEQLWLGMVMHEKYKKRWDDVSNEWVETRLIIEKKSE